MKKVVFLQLELSGYFMACVNQLVNSLDCEVHIYRLPVNKEAPFDFEFSEQVIVKDRHDYSDQELMEEVQAFCPDAIFCSGWVDKGYLAVCSKLKASGVTTIISLDNHWFGSLKQRILTLFSRVFLLTKFSRAWVPGEPQKAYAMKLGFKPEQIETGYYCCDTTLFNQYYKSTFDQKRVGFPKRILYVGRYLDFKGINDLFTAFKQFRKTNPEWELWCAGTGDLYDSRPEMDGLKHFGFVQPAELVDLIAQCGVYVLPSHKEPWAVTIHEMSVAGMPIICSDQVGAATHFIDEASNGYVFPAGSVEHLQACFEKMAKQDQNKLVKMGEVSHQKGVSINLDQWVSTVKSFMK